MVDAAANRQDDHATAVERNVERLEQAEYRGLAILDIPTPDALIEGVLDLGTTATLYGPSGSGKSFIALDIACTVAAGLEWQGKRCEPHPVLYIAAEGAFGIGDRVTAWLSQFKEPPDLDDLVFVTIPANLFDATWSEALQYIAIRHEAKLIVVDTLARSIDGADENSAKDIAVINSALAYIVRKTGACVLVVHHTGYDTSHARGSTAFRAAVDTELEVKGANGSMTLKATKQRHHADGDRWHLKLEGPDGEAPHVVRDMGGGEGDLHGSALDLLVTLAEADAGNGLSATEWRQAADCGGERNFYQLRGRLVQRGVVENVGTERRPRYRVSTVGQVELKTGGVL